MRRMPQPKKFNYVSSEKLIEMMKEDMAKARNLFSDSKTRLIMVKDMNCQWDSEKFARNYFEKKEYIVLRPRTLKFTTTKHKDLIKLLVYFFEFDEKRLKDFLNYLKNHGVPDFLIYNEKYFFFIEVKSEGGSSIQRNQIQFLEYLNELEIPNFIFLVHNQEPLKQEQENE